MVDCSGHAIVKVSVFDCPAHSIAVLLQEKMKVVPEINFMVLLMHLQVKSSHSQLFTNAKHPSSPFPLIYTTPFTPDIMAGWKPP